MALREHSTASHPARRMRQAIMWLGLLGGVALLMLGLYKAQQQWADAELVLDLRLASLALALATAYWLLGGTAWWVTLQTVAGPEVRPPNLRVALAVFFVGNLGRYLPGKLWYIAGRSLLGQQRGMDPTMVDGSTVLELAMISLSGALITAAMSPFLAQEIASAGVPPAALALAPLALTFGLIGLHPRLFRLVLVVIARARQRLAPPSPRYRAMLGLLAVYLGVWTVAGGALYATVASVATVAWSQLPSILGIWAIAYLAGFIAPLTPAGLGVREATAAALLATIIPLPSAIGAAILFRLILTAAEASLALPLLIRSGMMLRR